jgi:Protein of unknown function (DUF1194)
MAMRPVLAILAFAVFFCLSSAAKAENIDLEIVLAADVSRSIDEGEFNLQRKGYAAALTDPSVLAAIRNRPDHAIAVCFVEWSGPQDQQVVVDWTAIHDAEDAGGVAEAILKAPRSFTGRTSISAAIDFAMQRFAAAKWQAKRRVIDISGDGTSNSGRPITEARDEAIARGVTINGLAIINNKADLGYSSHTHPPGGLPKYYQDHVVGGTGSFLFVVKDFNSFAQAMAKKLAKEIDISLRDPRGRLAALP